MSVARPFFRGAFGALQLVNHNWLCGFLSLTVLNVWGKKTLTVFGLIGCRKKCQTFQHGRLRGRELVVGFGGRRLVCRGWLIRCWLMMA